MAVPLWISLTDLFVLHVSHVHSPKLSENDLFSMKPPLREPIIDVPLLVNHFLRTYCLIEGKERAAGEYSLATSEKNLISQVLQKCNRNKHETARVLRISRTTLYSKLKKHKIQSHER
ncbi:MAG: helix-turn-helix domain-containing protein [Thermodesulfobacteriota bacterium]|nr:helix-turn-helix domain-containing protein [Thermodesulfobacteriota bacterium]